jgi:soluble lytic murein transglycosylase-like protein
MHLLKQKILVSGVLIALCFTSSVSLAQAPIKEYVSTNAPQSVQAQFWVQQYAKEYGVKDTDLLSVGICESSFNQKAVGDHGLARGIFQFHPDTWIRYEKKIGFQLDRESFKDQARLASFAFSIGGQREWSCWNKNHAKIIQS